LAALAQRNPQKPAESVEKAAIRYYLDRRLPPIHSVTRFASARPFGD
jgi:hypothetical protein